MSLFWLIYSNVFVSSSELLLGYDYSGQREKQKYRLLNATFLSRDRICATNVEINVLSCFPSSLRIVNAYLLTLIPWVFRMLLCLHLQISCATYLLILFFFM